MPAQVRPPHRPGLKRVREGPFEQLPTRPEQCLATAPADATAVGVHGVPFGRFVRPVAAPTVGLRNVAAVPRGGQRHQHRVAVVPLVGHDAARRGARRAAVAVSAAAPRTVARFAVVAASVVGSVVVSPAAPPVSVTASTAPVSRSTACSCLAPSACAHPHLVIWASGSCGFTHSPFAPFCAAADPAAPAGRASASRCPRRAPAPSETPRSSGHPRAARSTATPRSPPASSRTRRRSAP